MAYLADGFIRLYQSERGRLVRLVARIVGNDSTAEELVQDAFSKLVKTSDMVEIKEPGAYLTRSARNLALNHLRHLRHGIEVSVDETIYNAAVDPRPTPEMQVLYRQELVRLLTALSALPPRRREIFLLHRFDGLSYGEIAEKFELSKRTVINHIFNALDDLDLALGPDFLNVS